MRIVSALAFVAAAGCKLYSGGPVDGGRDQGVIGPQSAGIDGTTAFHGAAPGAPASGVLVAAKQLVDDSLASSTQTASDGTFELGVMTHQGAAQIYLEATAMPYVATYYDFPGVVIDVENRVALDIYSPTAFDALFTAAKVSHDPAASVIEVHALTIEGSPLAGANVIAPGTIVYNSSTGATGADGIAYILDAQTGEIGLGAPNTTSVYVRVVPGAISETVLQQVAPIGGDY